MALLLVRRPTSSPALHAHLQPTDPGTTPRALFLSTHIYGGGESTMCTST